MNVDIARFSRLPSLPTIAVEALRLFHDPNSSNDQLVSVIRKDPAIVGKLLKAANSVKYGLCGEVTDLNRAVMMLGRTNAAPLVLSFSLARQSMESSEHLEHYQKFWLRSFVQATAAEVLCCQSASPAFRSECYITNLLAGLGKLALLRAEPERYLEVLRKAAAQDAPPARFEQEEFGFTHSELSSVLLQQMGLPERCHQAILAIGDSNVATDHEQGGQNPLIQVTRIADAVACLLCDETAAIAVVALQDALTAIELSRGLTAEELLDRVRDRLEASAPMFDIDPPKLPSAGQLLQDALDQLSRIAAMPSETDQHPFVPTELLEENGRLKRRVADLLQMSRLDGLTGLCNRSWFLQQFAESAALHRVRGQPVGMAVVDIDHFKKINDTYGHQAGDLVLKIVADTLKMTVRDDDLVGRYGGEEFVVFLANADPEGLRMVGDRLRSGVEQANVIFEGKHIPVTASIGLVEGRVSGNERQFGELVFAAADAAMYRAKNSGRNCIVIDSFAFPTDSQPVSRVCSNDAALVLT